MSAENQYDPMVEFWKGFFPWLFKQGIAAIISILFLGVALTGTYIVWQKMGDLELRYDAKMAVANSQWSKELTEVRSDLRHCIAQKDTLMRQFSQQAIEMAIIKANQRLIIRSQKISPSFGVKN